MVTGKKKMAELDTVFASAVAAYGIAIAITLAYALTALPSGSEKPPNGREATLENLGSARSDMVEIAWTARPGP